MLGSEDRDLYGGPLFTNASDFHQACNQLHMGNSLAAANASANEAREEVYSLKKKLLEVQKVAVQALEKVVKT